MRLLYWHFWPLQWYYESPAVMTTVYTDNKLTWTWNAKAVLKKGKSRLWLLRRLRSFNVCRTVLRLFYESVVAEEERMLSNAWFTLHDLRSRQLVLPVHTT